jgi:hypothetical protein
MTERPTHAVRIELCEPLPPDVAVGSNVRTRVAVSCAAGCDLADLALTVTAPDGTTTYALGPREGAEHITDIIVTAPTAVGEHRWHVATPAHRVGDIVHTDATLNVAITTRPHHTSLAVWEVPDVAVAGEAFAIKAGVKCADGCALQGHRIDIVAADGTAVTSSQAGDTPWSGTAALYWAQLAVPAPPDTGMVTLSARVDAQTNTEASTLAHDGASSSFTVAIVKPPEHTLTVTVTARESATPVTNADVRLGPYRATTDASGRAELRIAGGAYELHVWKAGYEMPARALDIRADTSVEIEAVTVPEEDPDARWKM